MTEAKQEPTQAVIPGLEGIASNEDVLKEQRDNLAQMTTEELDAAMAGLDNREPNKFGRQAMATLKSLSVSSITGYLDCPFQWFQNYVVKDRKPSNQYVVFGGAVHKVWTDRQVLKVRGESGIDLARLWHTEFGKEIQEREKKFGGIDWEGTSEEEVYQEGLALWDTHDFHCDFITGDWEDKQEHRFQHIETFMDMFPTVMTKSKYDFTPVEPGEQGYPGTERFAELWIPGVPKKLLGFIDWMGSGGIAHDLKTSGRSWYEATAESEIQPNIYLALLLAKAPHVVHPDLIFKHVILVRNKKHKGQVISHRRTLGQIKWVLRIVERVYQDMAMGRIMPNPKFQWCGPRCDYWERCMGNVNFKDDALNDILNASVLQERKENLQERKGNK